ncbi:MAG: MBL fold metallo-hydrolase [Betaproteobacteria bacterium]|nr:MBL fold metallo-hydrolase [Betaproteobacteria bacterium]
MKNACARLSLFLALIAAILAFSAPLPVAYALPPAPAPAPAGIDTPGFYRLLVGDFEVVALFDGHSRLSQQLLKGINAKDAQALLQRAFHSADRPLLTSVNAYLVHTGQNLVLVDTGAAACFGPTLGNVQNNLKAAGYKPEDVDTILLTHMHPDHVCGLTDQEGKEVFPEATVWVARDEAAYWLSEEIAAKTPEETQAMFRFARDAVAPYAANGRFKTFVPGEVLLSGIATAPSNGHTPGHSGYFFASQGQSLLIWGDIAHNQAIQFARPEVAIEFDADQKQAIAARKQIFADAARKRLLIAGAHLPFPGIGHIVAEKNGYRWVPVEFGQNFPDREAGTKTGR